MKPLTVRHNKKSDALTGWLFLAPTLIIFVSLIIFPVIVSLFLSFTQWNFMKGLGNMRFIGVTNFIRMFRDRNFVQSIWNTMIYTVTTVPVSLVLALGIAYVLNGKIFGMKFLRLGFFVPYISSSVALAAVFKVFFRSDGIVNQILQNVFQITVTKDWFMSSELSKIPIIIFVIWTALGYELIIYLAALQNIPSTLYEAAEIDGAPVFYQFLRITVPMISSTTFYLLIIRLIATFKIFTSVNVMTLGSANRYNTSMVMQIYNRGFGSYDFGYASAEAWFLFVIILAVTVINFRGQKKWVHY
jgi:multiple sugar transport system permease protein